MFLLLVVVSIFSTGLSMPGGWSDVDSKSWAEFMGILTESEGKLYTLGLDYKVTKMESQVVAGRNIKYTIEMKNSTCTLTIFDQPWTQTRRVLSDTCSQLKKRQLAGGYSPVDNDNLITEYKTLLNTVTSSNLLSLNAYKVLHIESQVVSGVNVRYTLQTADGQCTVTVYSQVWTSTLKVTSNTCSPKSVRQLGGVRAGGYTMVDPKSFDEYEPKLRSLVGTNQQFTIQQIETQVVSGVNIKYTLSMPGMQGTCQIVVYSQVWTQTLKITQNNCPTSAKRQLLGGYNKVDINDPMVQKCLSMSLDKVNKMSNSMFRMVESHIDRAEQQDVAGMNYAITFQTGQSTCMNSQDMMGKTGMDCPVDTNSVMTPTTWSAHCFRNLGGHLSFTGVDMVN